MTNKSLCVFASVMLMAGSSWALDVSRMRLAHPSGSGELFHGGGYATGPTDGVTMENYIRRMSQAGLTHIYFSWMYGTSELAYCTKWGTHASLQAEWIESVNDMTPANAQSIATHLNDLWSSPAFLAYSIREEPPVNDWNFLDALHDFYTLINSNSVATYGHEAPFYLIYSNHELMEYAVTHPYKPLVTATDQLYFFTWPFYLADPLTGTAGWLFSPARALGNIAGYMQLTVTNINYQQQWPTAVLPGVGERGAASKAELAQTYGANALARYEYLASYNGGEGNQGWRDDGDNLQWAGIYLPPPNCMSAQTWLSVATGYRAVLVWAILCDGLNGPDWCDLRGPDSQGDEEFEEFTSTVRELQKFGWLINRMEYQPLPAAQQYIMYGAYLDFPLTTFSGSFNVPGFAGKVAVLVNADVATWCPGSPYGETPMYFTTNHVFRVGDYGRVHPDDYIPKTAPRAMVFTNQVAGTPMMYDLETGTALGTTAGSLDILPGKGKFIFIGSQTELDSLRARCGLTTITAHSGLVPNRETIPDNFQVVYTFTPITNDTSYVVVQNPVALANRYRVHVTASSADGAQLGVATHYYARGTWDNYLWHFWNVPLSATPTTFVSGDFSVDDPEATGLAYTAFYRSNQAGTLVIADAWIEDSSTHHVISSPFMDATKTHAIGSGQRYQVYARARNYPWEATPATFGINVYEYNSAGQIVWTNQLLTGVALTDYATNLTAQFERQSASAVTARVEFVRSNANGTLLLESACVGQVLPPTVLLTAPADGTHYLAPASLVLTATTSDNDATIARVEFYDGANKLGEATTVPYSYTWNAPPAGKHTLTAKVVDTATGSGTSSAATVWVWATQDIGSVGQTGSASYNSPTFTLTGAGAGITGSADALRFAYLPVTGNFTGIVRVASFDGTALNSRAGLMVRESLNANAREASALHAPWYSPDRVYYHRRTSTGGSTSTSYGSAASPPYWVRLIRNGNSFSAWRSATGTSWTQVGSTTTISMSSTLSVGLAVTSGSTTATKQAMFDNVSITQP